MKTLTDTNQGELERILKETERDLNSVPIVAERIMRRMRACYWLGTCDGAKDVADRAAVTAYAAGELVSQYRETSAEFALNKHKFKCVSCRDTGWATEADRCPNGCRIPEPSHSD